MDLPTPLAIGLVLLATWLASLKLGAANPPFYILMLLSLMLISYTGGYVLEPYHILVTALAIVLSVSMIWVSWKDSGKLKRLVYLAHVAVIVFFLLTSGTIPLKLVKSSVLLCLLAMGIVVTFVVWP